mmetsp:Transcript_108340/g.316967  ORF Transcript_108340/g.316967 Transcript_108340/m.316967 type:complete len:368 (+) Transcript_108340:70-1173(+)
MAKSLRRTLGGLPFEWLCSVCVLVLPRLALVCHDRAARSAEGVQQSSVFQKLGSEFWGYATTRPSERYEPWCCAPAKSAPSDGQAHQGDTHVLYAASSADFAPLARSVLSLARALTAEDARPVTIHWVVRAEDMEQARRVQDCLERAFEGLATRPGLELHELREHFGRLSEKAQARARLVRPMAFVKFYMYEYLPATARVIWLDPETIVQADIRSLYSLQMNGVAAVACNEGGVLLNRAANMEELIGRLVSPTDCFLDPAVLLANLTTWKSSNHTVWLELWMNEPDVYMSRNFHAFRDQTIMNLHFQPGMIDKLDQRWNVFHVGVFPEPIPPCCMNNAYIFRFHTLQGRATEHAHIYEAHSQCDAAI